MSKGRLDHRVSLPSAASQLRVGAWCGPGRRAAALVLCLVLGVLGSVCEAFGQAAMPPGWTPYGYTRPYYGDYGRVPRPVQQVVTGAGERAWFYGDLAYGALQGMSYLLSCGYAVLPNPPAQSPALQNFDRSCKEDGFWSTTGSNFIRGVNPYEWGRGISEPLCNDAFALGMGDECAWESCKLLGGLAVDGVVARPVQGIGRPISGGKPGRIIVPEDPLQNIVAYAKPEPVPGFGASSIIVREPPGGANWFLPRRRIVLDVGCGRNGSLAAPRLPGDVVIGIDPLLEPGKVGRRCSIFDKSVLEEFRGACDEIILTGCKTGKENVALLEKTCSELLRDGGRVTVIDQYRGRCGGRSSQKACNPDTVFYNTGGPLQLIDGCSSKGHYPLPEWAKGLKFYETDGCEFPSWTCWRAWEYYKK